MRKTIYRALLLAIVAVISVIDLIALDTRDASANGAPVKIILTYLQGVSNWGPTSATGVAEVVMKEGEVNISVVGLPALADETYAGWLIDTKSNQVMTVGRFNADQSEVVKARLVLPSEIPSSGWDLFLVTVEPKNGALQAPGDRKSIGGYFPDSVEANRQPAQLPKTGGDTGQVGSAPKPAAAYSPTPAPRGGIDLGNNTLTFGIVALAAVGLGVITRARAKR